MTPGMECLHSSCKWIIGKIYFRVKAFASGTWPRIAILHFFNTLSVCLSQGIPDCDGSLPGGAELHFWLHFKIQNVIL